MKPSALLRRSLFALAWLSLTACERDEDSRLLEQIERARTAPKLHLSDEKGADATSSKGTGDQLGDLQKGQRLVLYCAADLRDPVQTTEWRILQSVIPALGSGLVLKHLDAAGDAGAQLRHLQAAARATPAVLIFHPLEFVLSAALLQDIRASGTVVLAAAQGLPADAWDQCAYVDQEKVGAAAADVILAALKRKAESAGQTEVTGRVVQISLFEDSTMTKLRTAGLEKGLLTTPGVRLVHDAPGEATREGASARLAEASRLQGTFDAILVHSDVMALAISDALSAAGRREDTLIVSIGGLRDRVNGLELLRQGSIDALIGHPLPMEKLHTALVQIAADADHRPGSAQEELPPVVLTPRNMNDRPR
jgi:ribose transport system substrate-binding protein